MAWPLLSLAVQLENPRRRIRLPFSRGLSEELPGSSAGLRRAQTRPYNSESMSRHIGRRCAVALAVAGAILLGTHATQRNRRDEFHVARIKAERQVNFMPGTDLVVGAVSKMILDVAAMIL